MKSNIRKNVIIYGGAFNPPTIAHLEIIKACLIIAQEQNAEVWITPSGDRRDKKIAVPREKRLAFASALASDAVNAVGGNCHAKTFELDRIVPTETIDSVNELNQQHPDKSFTFVFGAD